MQSFQKWGWGQGAAEGESKSLGKGRSGVVGTLLLVLNFKKYACMCVYGGGCARACVHMGKCEGNFMGVRSFQPPCDFWGVHSGQLGGRHSSVKGTAYFQKSTGYRSKCLPQRLIVPIYVRLRGLQPLITGSTGVLKTLTWLRTYFRPSFPPANHEVLLYLCDKKEGP